MSRSGPLSLAVPGRVPDFPGRVPDALGPAGSGAILNRDSGPRGGCMKRPTISDIAQRAGVTKAAVSFALNGRPGVSPATRERILSIAAELGFQPSSAAQALTAGQAGAFGLVLSRP